MCNQAGCGLDGKHYYTVPLAQPVMIKVYQAEGMFDAQFVHDQLRAAGIDCAINGRFLSGAIGELPVDATPSVWVVEDSDAERAQTLVGEIEARRRAPIGADWFCGSCDEPVADSFDACWKCGGARPSAD